MPPHDRAILTLVSEVIAAQEMEEFARGLLAGLHEVVPSDWVSLNGISPEPSEIWAILEPAAPAELFTAFQRLAGQNPLIARLQRTQDGRAYRFSDVVSQAELHALEIHREVYAPMGLEHQLAFTLPAEPGHFLGVALSRKAAAGDFTDDERDLLDAARPYLIQAYRNAVAFEGLRRQAGLVPAPADGDGDEAMLAAGLTPREAEVVRAVVAGRTNQQAAEALGLSVRTVQKHLERVFRKLGVRSRTEAAAHLLGRAAGPAPRRGTLRPPAPPR